MGCSSSTPVADETLEQTPWLQTSPALHTCARTPSYPGAAITRAAVPDDLVDWTAPWPEYKPVEYTAPSVLANPVWADKEADLPLIKFNERSAAVNRVSFGGPYTVDPTTGHPRNPHGRTGIVGRGLLGRFGVNHAADPIVTRWKRDSSGERVRDSSSQPILEFAAILRQDSNEWALPGGMVDPGEVVTATVYREFCEEALNSLEMSESEKEQLAANIRSRFGHGDVVYRGYVDDPRNTDSAWLETVALNFHDEDSSAFGQLALTAGDDAKAARWKAFDDTLVMYASHGAMVKAVRDRRLAMVQES